MVIKVYISGISASKEIKKRQQRALLILDSCKVDYEPIDITEPGLEEMREFMVQNSKIREPNKTPLSPQFFNDDVYCGDYEDFDSAVEINQVFPFLKLENNGSEYCFNSVNNKTTNGDHKEDSRKSISPDKADTQEMEDNEEGEVKNDGSEKGEGEDREKEEEDEFWAQDDSKKRKKENDAEPEEIKENQEEENDSEDGSKRLKTDEDEEAEAEAEEEGGGEDEEGGKDEDKEELESEKVEEGKEEEEEDDFWGGKGD